MKKTVSKLIACGIIAGMLCTGAAMAADPIAASKTDSVVTVSVSNLGAKEETTLLVVAKDVAIEDAFADTTKVYHIDQTAADDAGVATFSFTYAGSDALDIYSGYSSMSATDVPYKTVIDEAQPPVEPDEPGDDEPTVPTFIYGDVNNDTSISVADAGLIVDNFLTGADFLDAATGEVYEYGAQAADVDGNDSVTVADAGLVIDYFLSGTPFPVTPAE